MRHQTWLTAKRLLMGAAGLFLTICLRLAPAMADSKVPESGPDKAPESTEAPISHIGAERLESLLRAKIPESALRMEIASLRQSFEAQILAGQELVSDGAILLLEAIALGDKSAARNLLDRYDNGPLPLELRKALTAHSARRFRKLAAESRDRAPRATLRLHPFWWSTPGCLLTGNGRLLQAQGTFSAEQGSAFYVQRVCTQKAYNRLARGLVPLGRDSVFVAFRGDPTDSLARVPLQNPDSTLQRPVKEGGTTDTWSLGLSASSVMGTLGQAGIRAGGHGGPTWIYGLAAVSPSDWGLDVEAGYLDWKPTGSRATGSLLFAATLNRCHRVSFDSLSLEPFLGAGVLAISPGQGLLSKARYLAPHVQVGVTAFWVLPAVPLKMGPRLAWGGPPPPWRGSLLSVGLELEFRGLSP